MRKLLPLLVILTMVGNAAPKSKSAPAIDNNYSCTPGVTANCDVASDFSLTLTGLDPKKTYLLSGTSPSFGTTIDVGGAMLSPTGDTLTLTDNLGTYQGTWTFTLYQINPHNGNASAVFDSITISFD